MKFQLFSFLIINIIGICIGINSKASKNFCIFRHEMFNTVNNGHVWSV